jgi:hypothetical protein
VIHVAPSAASKKTDAAEDMSVTVRFFSSVQLVMLDSKRSSLAGTKQNRE